MKKLFLTRHGETIFNAEIKFQGQSDSPLTQKGIDQAKRLGKRLRDIKFDRVYSSPLKRALDTTKLILEDNPSNIIIDDRIKEIRVDPWCGREQEYIKQNYSEQLEYFWNDVKLFKLDGCETYQELYDRNHEFIRDILKQDFENILIVCHGVVLKSILMPWENRTFDNFWDGYYMHSTCVNIIDFDCNPKGELILGGDVSHLE